MITFLTLIILLLALITAFAGWRLSQHDPDADYLVREEAGEFTAEERADEAAEERAIREHLASKYSTYSD
jgi:hypothetical protein